VLTTRLNRLPTLTFSGSSGFKNTLPHILYLLQAKTGQSHTMCTLSSLSCPHSRNSCRSLCQSLYRLALRLVWPVNSPTAALSLNLLIVRSSLALLDRGYLFSILDCRQPVHAVHLDWCSSSKSFLISLLPTPKIIAVKWLGGTSNYTAKYADTLNHLPLFSQPISMRFTVPRTDFSRGTLTLFWR
jgi:hypothetical protein